MFIMKKRFYLIIIICFLTMSLSSHYLWAKGELEKTPLGLRKDESTQEQVSTQNQPQISFDSINYDAGEVYEGDEVVHTFTFKNTGTAQLNINKVNPG